MHTKSTTLTRHLRIAFLVDLAETSHTILDAIMQAACSYWGGRFSLIVPCTNGVPSSAYDRWLRFFDPDLIYSYVDLNHIEQTKIHEGIYPSSLQLHETHDPDDRIPHLAIPPLSVATVIPLARHPRGAIAIGSHNLAILTPQGSAEKDQFLINSFGVPSSQVRSALYGPMSGHGACVDVLAAPPVIDAPVSQHRVISSTKQLLNELAVDPTLIGSTQLAAVGAMRLKLSTSPWEESFNLVIGSTVADRLLHWNSRAYADPWRDGTDVDLFVPFERLEDTEFLAELARFLERRNRISANSGGPYRTTLRSISIPEDRLKALATSLRKLVPSMFFTQEHIASADEIPPSKNLLDDGVAFVTANAIHRITDTWKEHVSSGADVLPIKERPEHLRLVPTAFLTPQLGAWAIDLNIERKENHSPYQNVQHNWCLPRRLRTTQTFIKPYRLNPPLGDNVQPRTTGYGAVTLYAGVTTSLPSVSPPSDSTAIVTALQRGRDWSPFKRADIGTKPRQLCYAAKRSSAGKHFWGVYQMFGGLNAACSVLQHQFWRTQFEAYEATDRRTETRRLPIQQKLLNKFGNGNLDLSNPEQLAALADVVLKESTELRTKTNSRKWSQFECDFQVLIDEFESQPHPEEKPPRDNDDYLSNLESCIQHLLGLGVLHQGYEHRCRKCLHRSWIGISDLKEVITCEVCHDRQPAPIRQEWQFRLNGFLKEALHKHGIAPLFWVLQRYQQDSRRSFWFEGPLDIYFDRESVENKKPATDIDLTIIDGGLVRMCEVKQSERHFENPKKLAEMMARLRPDVAVIAVMEPHSAQLQKKFNTFAGELRNTGIEPELLTLNADKDIAPWPFF